MGSGSYLLGVFDSLADGVQRVALDDAGDVLEAPVERDRLVKDVRGDAAEVRVENLAVVLRVLGVRVGAPAEVVLGDDLALADALALGPGGLGALDGVGYHDDERMRRARVGMQARRLVLQI